MQLVVVDGQKTEDGESCQGLMMDCLEVIEGQDEAVEVVQGDEGVRRDRVELKKSFLVHIFLKMCQLCIFVLCCHNSNSWCAWESNPGPQDGSCRQNHGAMAATPPIHIISNPSVYPEFLINFLCSFIKPSLTTRCISDFRTVFPT